MCCLAPRSAVSILYNVGDVEVPDAARPETQRWTSRTPSGLGAHLGAEGVPWAVVGGLALAAHGAGRLTHDLDIVTERRSRSR